MSTDWDVYCLDCEDEHGFYDANHQRDMMRSLATMGPQLAAFAPTMRALKTMQAYTDVALHLQHDRYPVDFDWFEKHGTHRLIARDEYGHNDDECGTYFKCGACTHQQQCRRAKEHEGDHSPDRDPPAPAPGAATTPKGNATT